MASTGTDPNPFQFGGSVGYYTDPAAGGLVLCGQRWYAPSYGRWLSRDPAGYDGGANLYAYCGGNPVGMVDPSGNAPEDCVDLINEINNLRDQLAGRYDSMRNDLQPVNIHPLYPFRPGPNPAAVWKGTWPGHQVQYANLQRRLRQKIKDFDDGPCGGSSSKAGMAGDAWFWATNPAPTQPKPAPQLIAVFAPVESASPEPFAEGAGSEVEAPGTAGAGVKIEFVFDW